MARARRHCRRYSWTTTWQGKPALEDALRAEASAVVILEAQNRYIALACVSCQTRARRDCPDLELIRVVCAHGSIRFQLKILIDSLRHLGELTGPPGSFTIRTPDERPTRAECRRADEEAGHRARDRR